MAQKTSINIKPCNIGNSEAHNRRTAEYLANIRKEKFYIRTDLMAGNETWVSPDFGEATLTDRYNQIACNLQIFLCFFLEKLNMPQNTPVTKAS